MTSPAWHVMIVRDARSPSSGRTIAATPSSAPPPPPPPPPPPTSSTLCTAPYFASTIASRAPPSLPGAPTIARRKYPPPIAASVAAGSASVELVFVVSRPERLPFPLLFSERFSMEGVPAPAAI
eukprot:31197-Pelagococcus_subviridis.AAC.6